MRDNKVDNRNLSQHHWQLPTQILRLTSKNSSTQYSISEYSSVKPLYRSEAWWALIDSYENELTLQLNVILFSDERMGTKPRFEKEAKGNSDMA